MRAIIDGIRWRVRTGSPWRDVPAVYPPRQTLYRWFRRWQRDGIWTQILAVLRARADAAGLIGWTVSVDSTISRAHQHAAGARRDGQGQNGNRADLNRRSRACSSAGLASAYGTATLRAGTADAQLDEAVGRKLTGS